MSADVYYAQNVGSVVTGDSSLCESDRQTGREEDTWRLAPPQFLADPFSRDSVPFDSLTFYFFSFTPGAVCRRFTHAQSTVHLAEHRRQDYFPTSLHTPCTDNCN